jgi:hypothetical protein
LWTRRFKIGLLSIFIDDMTTPYLSTMLNMGEVVDMDDFADASAL